MIIRRLADVSVKDTAHGVDVRNVYNVSEVMVTIIRLRPGEKLKKHITPVDVVFYVLKGLGVVEVGDEKQSVSGDTLVESPKDIPHCWYNESDEDLEFMVIKAPRPDKQTVFMP